MDVSELGFSKCDQDRSPENCPNATLRHSLSGRKCSQVTPLACGAPQQCNRTAILLQPAVPKSHFPKRRLIKTWLFQIAHWSNFRKTHNRALVSQRDNVINMTSRPRRCSDSISFVVFVVSVLVCGCQDIRTVWSAEVRSPDGYWVASAQTIQHSGPGTAGLESSVFLKRDSSPRLLILGFLHRGDYQGNGINLTMHWASPSHLEVTYDGRAASLEFQAVKSNGVEISVRDLSGELTRGKDSQ